MKQETALEMYGVAAELALARIVWKMSWRASHGVEKVAQRGVPRRPRRKH